MSAAAQSSANIIESQWAALEERLATFHPNESYSPQHRAFLAQLMDEDGHLNRDARFALTMIRDELCSLLPQNTVAELVPFDAQPLAMRNAFFMDLMPRLKNLIGHRQDSLTNDNLNEPQTLFKFLEVQEDSIPLCLLVDIGWCLGFRFQPKSNSWGACAARCSSI